MFATGEQRPRSKYVEQKRKQRDYERSRRKTYKQGRKRHKTLLYLFEKGLDQLQTVFNTYPQIQLSDHERQYLRTIKTVLQQQQFLATHPAKELNNRIVSLPKPYVRPIIGGKENKRVEFSMKVHMLQVDGICMIDKMDFNAFDETTRLKLRTVKHQTVFNELYQLGADRIYATNANRKYLTQKKVFTCFAKKGPKTNNATEKKLKSIIANRRATVMEGSFGTHKTAYGLQKIKAKTAEREIIWVFFGIMTANAVKISKRRATESPPVKKAA